jgi:polyisoprenyl-phosphate glycosyltransferase
LMDRKVVEALRGLPERNRFVRGLRTFVGFKQTGLAYERAARLAGKPKYTFRALVRLAMDGLFNFSGAPLDLVSYLGWMCIGAASLAGAGALIMGTPAAWWVATCAIVGCTGLQLLGLGIVGEYIRRIFVESKNRPTYIVASLKRPRADECWREPPQTTIAA